MSGCIPLPYGGASKDQQIRFIKESLQPEQPEPNSHALEMKVSEVLETKNAAVQCTLLSPTKDDQLLEAIGLLRREQIELQTRVRTAEEAQFGAEQDAVGLRAQLEEARRGLTWYVGELKSALERRNEEARRKSEMVDVGVDVAWESRQVGGYKVTRDKKMQTENATLQQASTQTITEDRPPQTLPKPESIRRPSPMIHVIEALPPTFPTEPHDVDPHFDLDEPQHILDPQLSTIFRNDGLSFSQSEAPKKPDDTKPSRGETPSAAVETQTSARRTAEVGVLANLGLEMSATEPAVQLSALLIPEIQPQPLMPGRRLSLSPGQDVWECPACGAVNLPGPGRCSACGRMRRARSRPHSASSERQPSSPQAPKSWTTSAATSPQATASLPPPTTSLLTRERKGRGRHRQLLADVELLRRRVPVYQPVDVPVVKPAGPVGGTYLDQLPLPEGGPDARQYPDVQYLGLWRYLLKTDRLNG